MKKYTDDQFFGSPVRGVTSALDAIFGNKFEDSHIPEHILKAATERGTTVHKYIEDWLYWYNHRLKTEDREEPHLGLEYSAYEEMWKRWLDERIYWRIVPLHTELRLINKKLGMKGIVDCIAYVDGKLCMIDWKTSSNLDEWSTDCQLQLYYMLLYYGNREEKALARQIEELRCLSLTKKGYRWFKFNIDKKLGQAILKLWNDHYREIAEAEKTKSKSTKGAVIL